MNSYVFWCPRQLICPKSPQRSDRSLCPTVSCSQGHTLALRKAIEHQADKTRALGALVDTLRTLPVQVAQKSGHCLIAHSAPICSHPNSTYDHSHIRKHKGRQGSLRQAQPPQGRSANKPRQPGKVSRPKSQPKQRWPWQRGAVQTPTTASESMLATNISPSAESDQAWHRAPHQAIRTHQQNHPLCEE